MSKFSDSIARLVSAICIGSFGFVVLYGINVLSESDWRPSDLFGYSGRKEVWMTAKMGIVDHSKDLDKAWAYWICSNIKVKVKLRNSTVTANSDRLDVSYEMKAALTRPILEQKSKGHKVDYEIYPTFKFIDEDGFIIHSLSPAVFFPVCTHEIFENSTYLAHNWDDLERDVTIKTLLSGATPEQVASRVRKVICNFNLIAKKLQENTRDNDDPFKDVRIKK